VSTARDPGIATVFATGNRRDLQAIAISRGQVFGTVYGDVDLTGQQHPLDLFGE
jgi:hypothetical protein